MFSPPHGYLPVTTPQYCAYFTAICPGDMILSTKGKTLSQSKTNLKVFIMNKVVAFLNENPVQYLADAHGVIADFSGNPPYQF